MCKKLNCWLLILVLAVGLAACGTPTPPGAEEAPSETSGPTGGEVVATAFPQKDITFIVHFSPGGAFDGFARLLAPYLEKYLPRPVNVIIENVPGGEGNIGINRLYRAKPDGYSIEIFNIPGNVVNQILGGGEYDLTEFTWLGNISEVTYVSAVSPSSAYRSLADLQAAPEVVVGTTGISTAAGLGVVLAAERLGFKPKFITHDGSTEAMLSAIRGDTQFVQYPYASIKKHVVDSQDLLPLWVYSRERLPELPDVPTIVELGYEDLLDMVTMYRPVAAAPGVPADVAQILRQAFWQAANDPEFQQRALEQLNEAVKPADAEATAALIQRSLEQFKQYADILRQYR